MKYGLFFCQDASLGIQQISKHTFVNSINEMMFLWHTRFSFYCCTKHSSFIT